MKKIILITISCFCALLSFAQDYSYFTFVTATGTQQMASANLIMTISGSNLIADNGTQSITLALSDLQKMYFSDANGEYTGLQQTTFNNQTACTLYTADGKQIGTFNNMAEAVRQLNSGTYIAKQGSLTQKILIQ